MQGQIHHFEAAGNYVDTDGDDLIGFYFCFVDESDNQISGLIGPYNTGKEAEKACQIEWERMAP